MEILTNKYTTETMVGWYKVRGLARVSKSPIWRTMEIIGGTLQEWTTRGWRRGNLRRITIFYVISKILSIAKIMTKTIHENIWEISQDFDHTVLVCDRHTLMSKNIKAYDRRYDRKLTIISSLMLFIKQNYNCFPIILTWRVLPYCGLAQMESISVYILEWFHICFVVTQFKICK